MEIKDMSTYRLLEELDDEVQFSLLQMDDVEYTNLIDRSRYLQIFHELQQRAST